MNSPVNVTELLRQCREDRPEAADQLAAAIGPSVHNRAVRLMRRERVGHLLQPTALVNEFFLQVRTWKANDWPNRDTFYAAAWQIMENILIDHNRRQKAVKRGAGLKHVNVDEVCPVVRPRCELCLAVGEAFDQLRARNQRAARVAELSLLDGMTKEEVADTLAISTAAVSRDRNLAQAWFRNRL